MDQQTDMVRSRAYQIWENEGRPDGRDLWHWLEAERQIQSDTGAGGDRRPRATPPSRRTAAEKGDRPAKG